MDRKGFRRAADRQVVNAPEYFRRDTPMLLKALDDMELFVKQFNLGLDELEQSPMFQRQAD